MKLKLIFFCLLCVAGASNCKKSGGGATTTEVSQPPANLGLHSFYKKYTDADGIPVVSSQNVSNDALLRAGDIVRHMLKLIPDVKAKMIGNKIRVGIIGINEKPTQMPEYSDLYTAFPGTDWDNRARAYGATLQRPLTTNCEENLLCLGNDRYKGEEILTHEFAHAIHELGLHFTSPGFENELQAAYNNSKTKGLWANTYAISDIREYWAEGVQSWFNCNLEAVPANGIHNHVNTRTELQQYDPVFYALIKKYFPDDLQKHGCY